MGKARLAISEDALVRERPRRLRKLFLGVAASKEITCGVAKGLYRGGKGIGISDRGTNKGTPEDWDFLTPDSTIRCRYSEIWIPQPLSAGMLDCAGFSLMLFKMTNAYERPRQILAIHSEPLLLKSDHKARFKRGPHLHVDWADNPVPHCHFPLNLNNLNHVVTDIKGLWTALRDIVSVLQYDVLPRFISFHSGSPDWQED